MEIHISVCRGRLEGILQLALNDSLAFAPTEDNLTASPQLDEPTWPIILLIVCETEPEEVDDHERQHRQPRDGKIQLTIQQSRVPTLTMTTAGPELCVEPGFGQVNTMLDKSTRGCRCRTSWQEGRRDVWRGPGCRCRNCWPERRRNASGTTIRRPRTSDRETNTKSGTREKGDNWTAGNTRMSSTPVFKTPPRTRRRCQRSDPSECTQQLVPLLPFFHQEVLKDRRCGSPTAARTPPAHKPPASMSSSAGRLRHEPFDERSAWKFPRCFTSRPCFGS